MANERKNQALYYFHEGTNIKAYAYMGCVSYANKTSKGYTFRTWAPNAIAVSVVGDFCNWDTGIPMERISENGVWELKYPSNVSMQDQLYKFRIVTRNGQVLMKGDPFARFSKGFGDGASIICDKSSFVWEDNKWMSYRKSQVRTTKEGHYLSTPLNIYEVHLPSFLKHDDGTYFSYRELADELVVYVKRMGYTHIELLPITEYPYDPSWGYQVCGYFAPTSRLGSPDDFRYFINLMHTNGIGVILDWVPAHFPKDAWGLYEFDGTKLYEYQGDDRMESRSWGTRFFDLGRPEVQSFLISSAHYWIEEFHLDGLRVDAVASMLYLDFDRMPGEWIPNRFGGRENLEAIAFIKKLNQAVLSSHKDVLMIAEESTAFPKVTHPVSEGGLGFSLKWNMGWSNDLFKYISMDPAYRKYYHKALNFPIMYAFNENYVLPISHDEVVHGKRSLLDKMYGQHEAKIQQFRVALMLMMTYPGKKMLFMGSEYGQYSEWSYKKSLEWFMLDYPDHKALLDFVQSLNHFYLAHSELWAIDFSEDGFKWIDPNAESSNLVTYRRIDEKGNELVVAITFSGADVYDIPLPIQDGYDYEIAFESRIGCAKIMRQNSELYHLSLPAFSGVILSLKDKRGKSLFSS